MNVSEVRPQPAPTQLQRVAKQAQEKDADFLVTRRLNRYASVHLSPKPLGVERLPGQGRLFAIANSKGYFAAVIRDDQSQHHLICSPLEDLRNTFTSSYDKSEVFFTAPRTRLSTPSFPLVLTFACNDTRLVVGLAQGSIHVYDTDALINPDGSREPLHQFPYPESVIREISPNPGGLPELVAVRRDGDNCTHIEILDVVNMRSAGGWKRGEIRDTKANCLAWSPKGKQIALGLDNGQIHTFDPVDTSVVKTVAPKPQATSSEADGGASVISLTWLSNTEFYGIYLTHKTSDPDTDETHFILNLDSKSGVFTETKIRPPSLPFDAIPDQLVAMLRNWGAARFLMFVGDRSTPDIGLLGNLTQENVPPHEAWCHLSLDERSSVSLPLDDDLGENIVEGLEFDLTANQSVRFTADSGEEVEVASVPVLYAYASDGTMMGWHIIHAQRVPYPGMVQVPAATTPPATPSHGGASPSMLSTPIAGTTLRSPHTPAGSPPSTAVIAMTLGPSPRDAAVLEAAERALAEQANADIPSTSASPPFTPGSPPFTPESPPFTPESPPFFAADDVMSSDEDAEGEMEEVHITDSDEVSLGEESDEAPERKPAVNLMFGGVAPPPVPPAGNTENDTTSSSSFSGLKPATGFAAFANSGTSAFGSTTTTSKFAQGADLKSPSPLGTTASTQLSAFGQPSFGKSSFGSSTSQSAFGKPAFGQPTFSKPAFGQPAFGQSTFGQAASGHASDSKATTPATSSGFTSFAAATGGGFGAFATKSTSFSSVAQSSDQTPASTGSAFSPSNSGGGFSAFANAPSSFSAAVSKSDSKPVWSTASAISAQKGKEAENSAPASAQQAVSSSEQLSQGPDTPDKVSATSSASTTPGSSIATQPAPKTTALEQAPVFGQSSFAKPAFGQPAFGQPAFGQSSLGKPAFGQTAFATAQSSEEKVNTSPDEPSDPPKPAPIFAVTPSANNGAFSAGGAFGGLKTSSTGFSSPKISSGFGAFGSSDPSQSPFFNTTVTPAGSPAPSLGPSPSGTPSPLGATKSAFGAASPTTQSTSIKSPVVKSAFAAFSNQSTSFTAAPASGKSFGDLLRQKTDDTPASVSEQTSTSPTPVAGQTLPPPTPVSEQTSPSSTVKTNSVVPSHSAPTGSPTTGFGLGRPSTRPARSSPLASAPINGDDDSVDEQSDASQQARLSSAAMSATTRLKTPPLLSGFSPTPPPATIPFSLAPPVKPWTSAGPIAPSATGPTASSTFTLVPPKSAASTSTTPVTTLPSTLVPPGTTSPSPALTSRSDDSLETISSGDSSKPLSPFAPESASSPPRGSFALPQTPIQNQLPSPFAGSTLASPFATPTPSGGLTMPTQLPDLARQAEAQPQPVPEGALQSECINLFKILSRELEELRKVAQMANERRRTFWEPSPIPRTSVDIANPSKWVIGDLTRLKQVMRTIEAEIALWERQKAEHISAIIELESHLLKATAKKEEIVSFSRASQDPEFAKMLMARTLGPEHLETQIQLRRDIKALREKLQQLEDHIQASKKKLNEFKNGKASLKAPSLDTINRIYRNIDNAIDQQEDGVAQLTARAAKLSLKASESKHSPGHRLPEKELVRRLDVTPNVAVSTAAALNAEMSAQKLKRALLTARKEPRLNYQAVDKSPVAPRELLRSNVGSSTPQPGNGMTKPLFEGMKFDLKPDPGAPQTVDLPEETSGPPEDIVARPRLSVGSKYHAKPIPRKRMTTTPKIPPPPAFDWGPLPGVAPKSTISADLRASTAPQQLSKTAPSSLSSSWVTEGFGGEGKK